MKKISLITAFALASSTLALAAPSMTGKWSVHRSVSGNEGDSTCSFEQKDKALTGNCKSSDKEISVTGTVDGSKVTWKYMFLAITPADTATHLCGVWGGDPVSTRQAIEGDIVAEVNWNFGP